MVKQTVLLVLLVHLFWPVNQGIFLGTLLLFEKVIVLGLLLAAIESVLAKMRLFKLPELMAGGAAFCLLSIIIHFL